MVLVSQQDSLCFPTCTTCLPGLWCWDKLAWQASGPAERRLGQATAWFHVTGGSGGKWLALPRLRKAPR